MGAIFSLEAIWRDGVIITELVQKGFCSNMSRAFKKFLARALSSLWSANILILLAAKASLASDSMWLSRFSTACEDFII
jgi:hypothetical protein